MGLWGGVGDLIIWWPKVADYRSYPTDPETGDLTYPVEIGYMEVKRPGVGKQSGSQVKFQARCERHLVPYLVVYSVDDVMMEMQRRGLV
jgi:hypothetical protein